MKKISAVLLVFVLVGSVAFAGFTGSATTELGYDLDTGVYGFTNATGLDVDLVFHEAAGAFKGEGDVYAEIKASLKFTYNNGDQGNLSPASDEDDLLISGSVSSAKLIGKDWYVGILSALTAPNFAKSAIDSKSLVNTNNAIGYTRAKTTYYADLQPSKWIAKNAGIEVGFQKFVGSIGLVGNSTAGTYKVYASATAPEFEVADGLKVTVAGAGYLADTGVGASGSVKGAFTTDEVNASFAADVVYDSGLKADAVAKVAFDPVTLDLYYATGLFYNNADQAIANYLSAKAAFKVDKFDIAVTGKNLVNTQALSASAKFAATEEIAVTAKGGYTINGGAWNVGGVVDFTAEDFTVNAAATYASANTLEIDATIESTTMVAGATLYANYYVADIFTGKGAITTGVEIAF